MMIICRRAVLLLSMVVLLLTLLADGAGSGSGSGMSGSESGNGSGMRSGDGSGDKSGSGSGDYSETGSGSMTESSGSGSESGSGSMTDSSGSGGKSDTGSGSMTDSSGSGGKKDKGSGSMTDSSGSGGKSDKGSGGKSDKGSGSETDSSGSGGKSDKGSGSETDSSGSGGKSDKGSGSMTDSSGSGDNNEQASGSMTEVDSGNSTDTETEDSGTTEAVGVDKKTTSAPETTSGAAECEPTLTVDNTTCLISASQFIGTGMNLAALVNQEDSTCRKMEEAEKCAKIMGYTKLSEEFKILFDDCQRNGIKNKHVQECRQHSSNSVLVTFNELLGKPPKEQCVEWEKVKSSMTDILVCDAYIEAVFPAMKIACDCPPDEESKTETVDETEDSGDNNETTTQTTPVSTLPPVTTVESTQTYEIIIGLVWTEEFRDASSATYKTVSNGAQQELFNIIQNCVDGTLKVTVLNISKDNEDVRIKFEVGFNFQTLRYEEILVALQIMECMRDLESILQISSDISAAVQDKLYYYQTLPESDPVLVLLEDSCSGLNATNACVNGECNIDEETGYPYCQCSTGFSGMSCDIATEPESSQKATKSVVRMAFRMNLKFKAIYKNKNNPLTKALIESLKASMKKKLKDRKEVTEIDIDRLWEGSLGFDAGIGVDSETGAGEASSLASQVSNAVSDGLTIDGQSVGMLGTPVLQIPNEDGTYESVPVSEDVCFLYNFQGICKNGGTCVTNALDRPSCQCKDGFSGDTCESTASAASTSKLSAGIIAAVVVVVSLLVFGIFIACCVILKSNKAQQNYAEMNHSRNSPDSMYQHYYNQLNSYGWWNHKPQQQYLYPVASKPSYVQRSPYMSRPNSYIHKTAVHRPDKYSYSRAKSTTSSQATTSWRETS